MERESERWYDRNETRKKWACDKHMASIFIFFKPGKVLISYMGSWQKEMKKMIFKICLHCYLQYININNKIYVITILTVSPFFHTTGHMYTEMFLRNIP